MDKEIVMNVSPGEIRVAVLEDGRVVELACEREGMERHVGNIYKGGVGNVLPGMDAAFVDLGLERNAFLYVDDIRRIGSPEPGEEEFEIPRPSIRDMLKEGQEIVVQMIKEPIGTKGARVTTALTLPGRYLVLMPTVDYTGVSRRIEDEAERQRLRHLAAKLKPARMGLIVRPAAEGAEEAELAADRDFLLKLWRKIQRKVKSAPVPSVLYRDYDLLYRVIRDHFTREVSRLVIDLPAAYERVLDMLNTLAPHLKGRVELYRGERPLFEAYGIETEIQEALRSRVWLACGAYLVFDETEALTVIDVNTGKFTGSTSLEDTVLRTNLEAAAEIGRQIRLRNLGGIIIVDFIDMETEEERNRVLAALEAALRPDKRKTKVLGFTSLGLVEITRKKVHQSLTELLMDDCPHCEGTGKVISLTTLAMAAIRKIQQICRREEVEALLLGLHPSVAALLIGQGGANLSRLEEEFGRSIFIRGQEDIPPKEVRVLGRGTRGELAALALPVKEGEIRALEILERHAANPENGIARIEGYVIDVEGGGRFTGQRIKAEIVRTFRTYAKARVVEPGHEVEKEKEEAVEG
ncbi:MAG: Rne/Rng family ribonuclease [Firmicutes bacterium]|nr:Rne/Rng family ribonuclease [Bacillota bacterium]